MNDMVEKRKKRKHRIVRVKMTKGKRFWLVRASMELWLGLASRCGGFFPSPENSVIAEVDIDR